MACTHTLSTSWGKKNNLEVISLCVTLCLLLLWLLPVMWHSSARSHIGTAATWVPDGLFAREQKGRRESPAPPCEHSWEKAWWAVSGKLENWLKVGENISEVMRWRLSWVCLSKIQGSAAVGGRLSSGDWSVGTAQQQVLEFAGTARWVTWVFSCLQDLTVILWCCNNVSIMFMEGISQRYSESAWAANYMAHNFPVL